jgi:hypothetical protein
MIFEEACFVFIPTTGADGVDALDPAPNETQLNTRAQTGGTADNDLGPQVLS